MLVAWLVMVVLRWRSLVSEHARACCALPSCQRPSSSCSLDFVPMLGTALCCCTFMSGYRFCVRMVRSCVNRLKRVSVPCTWCRGVDVERRKPNTPSRVIRVVVVPPAMKMKMRAVPTALGAIVLRDHLVVWVLPFPGGEGTHRAAVLQRPSPQRALQEAPDEPLGGAAIHRVGGILALRVRRGVRRRPPTSGGRCLPIHDLTGVLVVCRFQGMVGLLRLAWGSDYLQGSVCRKQKKKIVKRVHFVFLSYHTNENLLVKADSRRRSSYTPNCWQNQHT